ncbi:FAD:protein FMN transferase [Chromatium okenii]|uniref:FAD:protein FMN transferase n=1 Tax=Chromatium okenii TaxID=61644 RepID=UPI001F5B4F94|nr:FAD:protein FMN transferase [Chromatium okenii]
MTKQTLTAGVETVLARVISEISTYDHNSELSQLNQNPSTEWIRVSAICTKSSPKDNASPS